MTVTAYVKQLHFPALHQRQNEEGRSGWYQAKCFLLISGCACSLSLAKPHNIKGRLLVYNQLLPDHMPHTQNQTAPFGKELRHGIDAVEAG